MSGSGRASTVPGLMRGNWMLHHRHVEVSPNLNLTSAGAKFYTPSIIILAQIRHRSIIAATDNERIEDPSGLVVNCPVVFTTKGIPHSRHAGTHPRAIMLV